MEKIGKAVAIIIGGIIMLNILTGCSGLMAGARGLMRFAVTQGNDPQDEKLTSAIHGGNVEQAMEAVADGAHVNKLRVQNGYIKRVFSTLCLYGMDPGNKSAAYLAVRDKTPSVTEWLLGQDGVDVNYADQDGKTVLMWAIINNNEQKYRAHAMAISAAKEILGRDIDINAVSNEGLTALDYAYRYGSSDLKSNDNDQIIELLTEHGAKLRPETLRGMIAAESNDYGYQRRVLETLTQGGGTVTGLPPILIQAISGNTAEVARIAKKEGPNSLSAGMKEISDESKAILEHMTLRHTCASGAPETLQALLDSGFVFDESTLHYAPAKIAAAYGNMEMLQYLADNGYDMQGTLPMAVWDEGRETMGYLIENAERFEFSDTEWGGAIDNAARIGDIDALKLLMPYTNQLYVIGALTMSTAYGHIDAVRFLLDMGIDPNDTGNFVDYSGARSAVTMACKTNQIAALEMFISIGADINSTYNPNDGEPLIVSIENNNFEIFKYLLEIGADVNAGAEQFTPLAAAIHQGQFEMVRCLVENGADVNLMYSDEMVSPIHTSLQWSSYNIIRYLLDQGADINVKGREGNTPLAHALEDEDLESAAVLLEYDGIDFTISNDKRETAMDYVDSLRNKKFQSAESKEKNEKFCALVDAYIAAGRQAGA